MNHTVHTARLEWLELMRGLAAVWVVLHHGVQSISAFIGPMGGVHLLSNGYLGVNFFFILSGFIIAHSSRRLESRDGAREYLRARIVRIYVPYLPVGVAVYVAYALLPNLSESERIPGLLTTLTLLPSGAPPALSVAWTLVHELIFYALFLLRFWSKPIFWLSMLAWMAAILVGALTDAAFGLTVQYFLSPLNANFAVGLTVYLVVNRKRLRPSIVAGAALSGVVLVGAQALKAAPDLVSVTAGFGLLVIAGASAPTGIAPQWKWTLTMGSASYALYLVHVPVHSLAVRALHHIVPDVGVWTAFTLISSVALCAGVVYWWVYERPALAMVRRVLRSKR